MAETTLTFIGTGHCQPAPDNDTASFVLNGHCLIDCGWNAAITMTRYGYAPLDIDRVLITHCHQDHYMGLAGVLFLRHLRENTVDHLEQMKIIGPAEDIGRVVELARAYIQVETFERLANARQEVIGIEPGETVAAGELTITTAPTEHSVQGLAYRIRDERTGVELGFSGDTTYLPELAEHFRGVDVLVYEASWGVEDPEPGTEAGHSGVRQSATIARDAEVGKLYLVHTSRGQEADIVAAAREIFPEAYMPQPGLTLRM
jgi:ribonuclease Z